MKYQLRLNILEWKRWEWYLDSKELVKNKLHVESYEAVEWMTPGDREDAHEEARWCTREDLVCVCVCSSSGCGQGRDKTVTRYSSFTRLREYIARLHSYQQQLETKRNSKSERAAWRWETWVYMGGEEGHQGRETIARVGFIRWGKRTSVSYCIDFACCIV